MTDEKRTEYDAELAHLQANSRPQRDPRDLAQHHCDDPECKVCEWNRYVSDADASAQ